MTRDNRRDIIASMGSEAVMVARHFLLRYQGQTRKCYRYDLTRYFRWCRDNHIAPLAATREDVDHYVASLHRTNLSSSSKARLVNTMISYYKISEMDEAIQRNPTLYVRRVKVPKESTRVGLTYLEFSRFMDEAARQGLKTHSVVLLLGMMGLRVSEVCNLQVEDFSQEQGHQVVRIVGKGNKPAICPISLPVWRVLGELLKGKTQGPLFRNRYNLPLTPKNVRRILDRVTSGSGILQKRITPHSLRHTYITQLLDAGVPLRDVQIGARHADPRTTLRYDRTREQLDRHVNYQLAIRMAGNIGQPKT